MPRVELYGSEQVAKNIRMLSEKNGGATVSTTNPPDLLVEGYAKRSIQVGSPGTTVIRYQAGSGAPYEHTASEEGSAPNTDTWALVSSIRVETTPSGIFVGSTLKYAGWLEFGTRKMGARPWLNPALEGNRATILRIFRLEIGRVI